MVWYPRVVGGEEAARRAVELPENRELAHLEERAPPVVVDEEVLERLVHVVGLARQELVVPDDLPAGGVEREHAVRVQRVPRVPPLEPRPWLRLRRRPVDEAGGGVVAARRPAVAAGAEHQRRVAPRVPAGLAGARHRRRAPHLVAGARVARGDEAGHLLGLVIPLAAVRARDHVPPHDDRPRRVAEPEPVVGAGDVPHHVAGARVEGDDVRVDRGQVDLVVVDGEVPGGDDAGELVGHVLVPVAPAQLAGGGVEGLDDPERAGDVEHAVVDERIRLGPPLGRQGPRPREPEPVRVAGVDLVEGAVAPAVQRAPPVDPVGGVRLEQHFLGDRRERRLLRLHRQRVQGCGNRDGQHQRSRSDSHASSSDAGALSSCALGR